MELANIAQFTERYADDGIAPIPEILQFHVTSKCNLRCRMCWCWGDSGTKPKRRELSVEEIKTMFDKVECSSEHVVLTGGEPLVRRDIVEILRYGKSLGRKMGLFTNATLITPEIAKVMATTVTGMVISLDGPEEDHDKIRGKGTFQKTMGGIKLVQDVTRSLGRVMPIRINCVISSINIMELDKMVDIAVGIGSQLSLQHIIFLDAWAAERHNLFMRDNFGIDDNVADGFVTRLNRINSNVLVAKLHRARLRAGRAGIVFKFMPDVKDKDWKRWYAGSEPIAGMNCPNCIGQLTIRSDGEVTPCEFIGYSFGNILEQELRDVWLSERARRFRKLLAKGLFPGCVRCCRLVSWPILEEIKRRSSYGND